MKKFILCCMLLAGISAAVSAQDIRAGVQAPDFTAKKVDGTTFTLSSLQGKYVVLDFWGSWCKWCIKGFPDMKTAYAKHKDKVEFVGIACRDTEAKWKAATEKYELTVHNFSDALTTTDSWLVTYVPRAILAYHDKRLQAQQADINRRLAQATPEEATQLLTELSSINALKKTINIKLGRIKK